MKAFKFSILFVLVTLFIMNCAGSTQTSIWVKPEKKLWERSKVALGYFQLRSPVPYSKLNYTDHLEFRLRKRDYDVFPVDKVAKYYQKSNIDFNRFLTEDEIRSAYSDIPFELFIQGSIYEDDRLLYDEENRIIIYLHLYNPYGEKIATVNYIYTGKETLLSGEMIDDSVRTLVSKIEGKSYTRSKKSK